MTQVANDAAQPQGGPQPLRSARVLPACCCATSGSCWRASILIPLATYLVSTRLPKTYEASAVLQLQSVGGGQSLPGRRRPVRRTRATPQTSDRVAALIETNGVADQAARVLHEPVGSLRGAVTAQADEDTGFITITASASTAEARGEARQRIRGGRAGHARQAGRWHASNDAIATTQAQLKKQTKNTRFDQLVQQLQGLDRSPREALGQNAQVIQPADAAQLARLARSVQERALRARLRPDLFAAVLVALVDRLDRRLHDPDDLEKLTGSPLLVHIPPSAFPGAPRPGCAAGVPDAARQPGLLQRRPPLDSLIVVSSLKGEGKTTVAANLAIAYARTGKRIIAMDADLRSPELALRLGLESTPGLSTVLAGDATLEEAVRVVEPFGDNLRVLPGGPPPPNPSELLGSARMAQLFDELVADSDLVIVDTPPLLVVSDSFGLRRACLGRDRRGAFGPDAEGRGPADGGRRGDGAHAAARRGGDRLAPGRWATATATATATGRRRRRPSPLPPPT